MLRLRGNGFAVRPGLIVVAALIPVAAIVVWVMGRYDTVKGEIGI